MKNPKATPIWEKMSFSRLWICPFRAVSADWRGERPGTRTLAACRQKKTTPIWENAVMRNSRSRWQQRTWLQECFVRPRALREFYVKNQSKGAFHATLLRAFQFSWYYWHWNSRRRSLLALFIHLFFVSSFLDFLRFFISFVFFILFIFLHLFHFLHFVFFLHCLHFIYCASFLHSFICSFIYFPSLTQWSLISFSLIYLLVPQSAESCKQNSVANFRLSTNGWDAWCCVCRMHRSENLPPTAEIIVLLRLLCE